MNRFNKGISNLLIIVIISAVVVVAFGGIFAYQHYLAQKQHSNTQNNSSTNISNSASSGSCGDFATFSDYVLKNIAKPDSQNILQMNKYVITSFRWKRSSKEPFVSYPIINGIEADYDVEIQNKKTQEYSVIHNDDFIKSSIKKDSDFLGQNISTEAKNLQLAANQINSVSFESSGQELYNFLRTFSFTKGDNIYSVVLRAQTSHQAPGHGSVTITCGQTNNQYNKVYNALNFKADSTFKNPYDNDYVAISDISPDSTVYALVGSTNYIGIGNYYYFNGTTAKLVSSDSYPANCATLESQKVGQGIRCVDVPSYNQRTVTY